VIHHPEIQAIIIWGLSLKCPEESHTTFWKWLFNLVHMTTWLISSKQMLNHRILTNEVNLAWHRAPNVQKFKEEYFKHSFLLVAYSFRSCPGHPIHSIALHYNYMVHVPCIRILKNTNIFQLPSHAYPFQHLHYYRIFSNTC
jgi:hypothetical protein